MVNHATFWDKIAPNYAKSKISNPEGYEYTLGRTRSHLGKDDRVLEIGSGTGSTALKLAPSVAHYLATDISEGMTDIARHKISQAGLDNISAEAADLSSLPPTEGGYGAVLAFNLMHLLPDIDVALQQIAALIRPGGLFIQKTPLGYDSGTPLKFRLIQGVIPLMQLVGKAPRPVVFPRPSQMTEMVERAGFDLIERHIDSSFPQRHYIVARKRP
ncbi:MAG: class I SAM-dependent methyltransferase [Pseudomonadota bacterium]